MGRLGEWIRPRLATIRRNGPRLFLAGYALFLAVLVGVLAYYGAGLPVNEASVDAVRGDPAVNVTPTGEGGYVLRDADPETERVGLVLYPGGRVRPESYLPTAAALVRGGEVTVVVPKMPINLAVLDPNAARAARREAPGVERWYVGGHSLGGAMACRYASGHPDRVEGVVLLAAYCVDDLDDDLRVLAVTGSRDRVLDRAAFRENRERLPPETTVVSIAGMNHSQFGAYTGQSGDGRATVTAATARRRLGRVLIEWFEDGNVTGGEGVEVNRAVRSAGRLKGRVRSASWPPATHSYW